MSGPNKRPCLPLDTVMLAFTPNTSSRLSQEFHCPKECVKTMLDASVSWGKGNFQPLREMLVSFGTVNASDMQYYILLKLDVKSCT